MGAFLVTSGLGDYVASLLVIIVRAASNTDWYPSEDPMDKDTCCFPLHCFLVQVQDCAKEKKADYERLGHRPTG